MSDDTPGGVLAMIPEYLSHLHGTPHGFWYYGCSCYPCYCAQLLANDRQPMSQAEWDELERVAAEVEAMTPEERAEFFRQESLEMMARLDAMAPPSTESSAPQARKDAYR